MVGPNIHLPLIDVLLRFRLYQVALTADVSKMYRAVQLAELDRDYHRFVWRNTPTAEEAIHLQMELHDLFDEAKFLFRKWNSSDPSVLEHVPSELKESHFSQAIPEPTGYTKTLGIE